MQISRRQALQNLTSFLLASPLLQGQEGLPPIDPLFEPIHVFDFKKLAKEKLDPIAFDYMDEGGKDEARRKRGSPRSSPGMRMSRQEYWLRGMLCS